MSLGTLSIGLSFKVWMLGNLARATYVGSSDYIWPYSYNICDPKRRLSQEINACDKVNHYGMAPEVGRGSPEIDIVEAMQGNRKEALPSTHIKRPYQSTSLQVSRTGGVYFDQHQPCSSRDPATLSFIGVAGA